MNIVRWLGFFILLGTVRANAQMETVCSWENSRDGVHFESISNRHYLSNVVDCANAMGDYMLRAEPIRGATMFDGVVWLKQLDGTVIGRCETRTVRPISQAEREQIPFFAVVGSDSESQAFLKRYPGIRHATEEQSVGLLRRADWQARFHYYFEVSCQTPTS